jgi:hypothetical protein
MDSGTNYGARRQMGRGVPPAPWVCDASSSLCKASQTAITAMSKPTATRATSTQRFPPGHPAVAEHNHALTLCQAIHERESWQAHEREGRIGQLSGSAFGKFDDPIDYPLQFGVRHRAATW